MSLALDALNTKKAVVSDSIIVPHHQLLAKSGCHSENGCYKEQLLSNFLENSGNFGQFLKNFRATSQKIWSNLWLRLVVPKWQIASPCEVIRTRPISTLNLQVCDQGHSFEGR